MSNQDTPDLAERLEQAMSGLPVLALARRVAGEGADRQQVETQRRRIQKYLRGEVRTMQPRTRRRFEAALAVPEGYFDPPAASPRGRGSLERRLAAVEAAVSRIEQQLFGAGELPG